MSGEAQDLAGENRLMRRFFVIWGAQACSLVGSALVQFALVWWLTLETGSATVLSFAMMMAILPQVALGPFSGALVDRWNRRLVMVWADATVALATLVLVLLFAAGSVEVWHIYAVLLVRSAGSAFHWPAMAASTSLMVPKRHLARVGGLNEAVYGGVSVAAPALGAVLMMWLPMWGVLSVDILTAAVAIAPLLVIRIPQPARAAGTDLSSKTVIDDMRDGLKFLRSWRGAMTLLLMALVVNLLFSPAMALTPLLVKSYFGKGVVEFATIEMTMGVATLIGGLMLGIWGGFRRKIVTTLVSGVISGAGMAVVGVVPRDAFTLAVVGVFVCGFMLSFLNGSVRAIMQASIPAEKQGRVFGLTGSLAMLMSPVGLAFAGPLADLLGVQIWFLVAGAGLSAVMAAGFFMPSLLHMEDVSFESAEVEER